MNPQDQQPPQAPTSQPYQPQQQPRPGQSNQPYQGQGYGQPDEQPQVVYMARPLEPQRQQMSPEITQKHEESKRQYPKLNLSPGEYIISSLKRHPIGLFSIWFVTGLVIVSLFAVVIALTTMSGSASSENTAGIDGPSFPMIYLLIPAGLVSMLALLFGFVASYIYNANRFYLTNESVIQHIQVSLFSQREQTISLANVEDASYSQDGIMPHLFDYGLLRLSTQGDETTYRFSYASSPQKQIAILNNAVENFKNVRPIEH